jgi:general secretion pathway protein A
MYERFFGLADEPFRLTPDPRYLYLSRQHADALAHLRLGLTESSGFVCITGDVGTGKTTLLRTFLDELGPDISTAYVFNPDVTVLELLRTIIGELGIESQTRSRKKLVDALNRHLLAQREHGRRSVVVIDEAQALSVGVLEEIRLLSNLETTTEKLLRIVLVGQPQLHELLVDPALVQLNQRITLRLHLGPLSRQETDAYVRHRLGVASDGQKGDLFTRAAIRALHRYSGGVPRLLNMFAHRALVVAFASEQRRVTSRAVRAARRELAAVPLPKRLAPRRALWWPIAAGACLGAIAVGAAGVMELRRADGTAVPGEARVVEDGAIAAPVPAPVVAPIVAPVPEPPQAAPAAAAAPASDGAALAERLVAVDLPTSARDAVDAVLSTWSAAPLATAELADAATLPAIAARRGLEHVAIDGNAGLLRLLDLPAVLELHLEGADGPRWAAIVSVSDGRWRLAAAGHEAPVDLAYLEAHWLGRAHVFWRDFERLGPARAETERGPDVERLRGLLERSGVASVRDFQREHRLEVDGLAGPLTRIVLYATVGGYASPSLGGTAS